MSGPREELSEAIGEREYFAKRLDDQIDWYEAKSAACQAAYKRLRLTEIVAAASIPLLAGFSQQFGFLNMIVAVMGLIVAVVAGILGLYRFQENWNEYRATSEALKQEKYLYLARAGPYDGGQPFERLVQRVEALLSRETTGWAQAMRAAGAAEKAKRERAAGARP